MPDFEAAMKEMKKLSPQGFDDMLVTHKDTGVEHTSTLR